MSSTQEVGEIFGEGSGPAHAMLRSPTVLIASVGLWGVNVYFFRLFGINYVRVLKHDLILLDNEEYERQKQAYHHGHGRRGGSAGETEMTNLQHQQQEDTSPSTSSTGSQRRSATVTINPNATTMKEEPVVDRSLQRSSSLIVDDNGDPIKKAPISGQIDYTSDNDEDLLMEDDLSTGGGDRELAAAAEEQVAVTWERLVCFSLSLLLLLHTTYYVWIDVLGGNQLGAVFAFYISVMVAIIFPLPTTRWLRKATIIVLQRACELVNPRCSCCKLSQPSAAEDNPSAPSSSPNLYNGIPRWIPFVDVFFADAMCSLSKVFFDWGMLLHMASHYPDPVPPAAHNILMPSAFAAIPFCIRARQCLIMYTVGRLKSDPKRFSHLWNALKYSTSIFPLCLSAYQKTIDPKRAAGLEVYLIILIAINSSYALYWDIVMDWGMMQNPKAACIGIYNPMEQGSKRSCGHTFMRPRLRFGVVMSAVIVIADCFLRFSWMLRFFDTKLFPSHDSFVLCTQFLEVFRRALWNLLRVEWENLKQIKSPAAVPKRKTPAPSSSIIPAAKNEEELSTFLSSPPNGKEKG